jgi:hypothetical protein
MMENNNEGIRPNVLVSELISCDSFIRQGCIVSYRPFLRHMFCLVFMEGQMTITLTREEAQQVLDVIERNIVGVPRYRATELLRARLAQPEPEPVMLMDAPLLLNGQPLYTAPPQREWQGLTDEEIKAMWGEWKDALCLDHKTWAQAIEAKLKEKNT